MNLENLWRKKPLLVIIVGAIALALVVSNFTQIAVFGFVKEVPIEFGYDPAQDYWIISSVISESESFKMVLRSNSTDGIEATGEVAETQRELQVAFTPRTPYSKTNMVPANILYEAQQLPNIYEQAPAYDVNDAGWLTTALYDLYVALGDVILVNQQSVSINYLEPRTVDVVVEGQTIVVNNLGLLPQGVEVPSGDLVLVADPYGQWHVWNKADLLKMIDDWNEGRTFIRVSFVNYDWGFIWAKTEEKGWLPQDVQLTHVRFVSYGPNMDYLELWYGGLTFAGVVSLYVPASLVQTIIYNVNVPQSQIVDVSPSELPPIDEGTATTLAVTVKNVGTSGTMYVSVTSSNYAITPLTATQREFAENETFTFQFEVFALNVLEDTQASVDILAYGRGGSDTTTIYGTILDVEGYTPPTPTLRSYLTVTVVEEGSFRPVSNMLVTVLAGTLQAPKPTDGSGKVEFDLGTFEGVAQISTKETTQYQKAELVVGITAGDPKEATLMVRPYGFFDWSLIVLAVALGSGIIVVFGVYKKRRKIL